MRFNTVLVRALTLAICGESDFYDIACDLTELDN